MLKALALKAQRQLKRARSKRTTVPLIDRSTVVVHGDSQTDASYAWPHHLEKITNLTVLKHGRSGCTAEEVLISGGALGVLVPPMKLEPKTPRPFTPPQCPVMIGHQSTRTFGWVDGVRVLLVYTKNDGWSIEAPAGGTIHAESEFLADEHTMHLGVRHIVWFGGNSIRNGFAHPGETPAEHVIRAYSRAIQQWGDTTIVCGYVPAYGDELGRQAADQIRNFLAQTVPCQFLDVRYRLQQAAPDILGRDLTEQEKRDIARGFVPQALFREDNVHLADATHEWLATIFAEFPRGATPELALKSSWFQIEANS